MGSRRPVFRHRCQFRGGRYLGRVVPATEQTTRSRPYWPALDGFRAVAVLLVFGYHLALPFAPRGGSIGVTMFFTLSGFLITSLLLNEHASTGTIGLRGFYRRRLLRLVPAMAVLIAVVGAYAAVSGRSPKTVDGLVPVALYVGNWVRAINGFDHLGLLEHTWSLAVEEQFYLLWPLIVLGVAALVSTRWRPVAVLVTALAGSVLSLVWRLQLWDVDDHRASAARLYNGTDTVADQLLLGCALAAGLHLLDRRTGVDRTAGSRWPVFLGAVAAPVALTFLIWVSSFRPGGTGQANDRLYLTWGGAAFALAAAVVIAAGVLAPRSPLSRVLSLGPLVAIGKVSYGIYLWHYPLILLSRDHLGDRADVVQGTVAVTLTVVAVVLSWRFVEKPFLARKSKRRPAPGSGSLTAPPARAAAVEKG